MMRDNKVMRTLLQTSLACYLLASAAISYANTQEAAKLERMAVVAKQLNYDGVFSFYSHNKSQSIRIIHRADVQGEVERVVALSGDARESIRTNDSMTCVYPEGKSVQQDHRPLGRGFPTDLLHRLNLAADHYTFSFGKDQRIAGHYAQELVMTPVDQYRYGYSLWGDKRYDLLIQADLVDEEGNMLERFAFSSVKIGSDISEKLLKPEMPGNEMKWSRNQRFIKDLTPIEIKSSPWQVTWIPDGFALVQQKNRFKLKNGAPIEQRVYSDGLSSVSVFFEKIRAQHAHLNGGSNRGGVHAFGTIINAHFVTVVGEVPSVTVEKVADGIKYTEGY